MSTPSKAAVELCDRLFRLRDTPSRTFAPDAYRHAMEEVVEAALQQAREEAIREATSSNAAKPCDPEMCAPDCPAGLLAAILRAEEDRRLRVATKNPSAIELLRAALQQARAEGRREASHEQCGISTGIDGRLTAGRGALDEHGFWERPCEECRIRAQHSYDLTTRIRAEEWERAKAVVLRHLKENYDPLPGDIDEFLHDLKREEDPT